MSIAIEAAHPAQPTQPMPLGLRTTLALWVLAVGGLAATGTLAALSARWPWLVPALVLAPVAAFVGAYYRFPTLRRYVDGVPLGSLVLLHGWRMVGLGFVFLYAHGVLPAVFALPAGLGDALTAWLALGLGIALHQGQAVTRRRLLAWNTLGLLDFAVALTLGLLSRPAPLGLMTGPVSTEPMAAFPLNLIPTLVVPFFLVTHLLIYARLRPAGGDPASAPLLR